MKNTINIFVLDDSDERIEWFKEQVEKYKTTKEINLHIAKEFTTAKYFLTNNQYDYIFLDFDLGIVQNLPIERTSLKIAYLVKETQKNSPFIVIHSHNPDGRILLKEILPDAVIAPFGSFTLNF